MQQIEFETEIKKNIIQLPEHLKNLNHKHVKVIILEDMHGNAYKKKLPPGFYKPLHTESYRIIGKREEIYER
ncbi:hypothetical protein QUF80_11440 [Desulfococcaceae bacterium HSG8]|nr:hypothetical protein [Desulfococcaceae bacterium HSG8]